MTNTCGHLSSIVYEVIALKCLSAILKVICFFISHLGLSSLHLFSSQLTPPKNFDHQVYYILTLVLQLSCQPSSVNPSLGAVSEDYSVTMAAATYFPHRIHPPPYSRRSPNQSQTR
jgi:hypothetical protein